MPAVCPPFSMGLVYRDTRQALEGNSTMDWSHIKYFCMGRLHMLSSLDVRQEENPDERERESRMIR